MGNALTDILLQIDKDEVLFSLNLPKGGMQLINTERSKEIDDAVSNFPKIMATGGSASNTINGITRLGMKGGFVGKIGKDQVEDYARRKGMDLRTIERWLSPNLNYELI